MRKPRQEFEGSTLELFFHVVLRLNGALIVQLKYYIKASVTVMAFGRGQSNHTLAWCVFFTNTVSQNHSYRNIYTVVMKNMINTIGKKIHTLETHHAVIK